MPDTIAPRTRQARSSSASSRVLIVGALALLAGLGAVAAPVGAGPAAPEGRVIVLGFDGASYSHVRDMIDEGRLPHLAGLAQKGTFEPLGTTHNAESAVAWAALNTGRNPSETAIPGFIKRDLIGGMPAPGLGYQKQEDRRVADMEAGFPVALLSRWDAPVLAGAVGVGVLVFFLFAFMVLLRMRAVPAIAISILLAGIGAFGAHQARGYVPAVVPRVVVNPLAAEPYWEIAARAGVPSVVLDAAMAWDRIPVDGAEVLAGLGLPDSRGGNGDWFIYTTDEFEFDRPPKGRTSNPAGTIFKVDDWRDERIETEVYGPKDFTALDRIDAELAKVREALEDDSRGWKEGEALRQREQELESERAKLDERRLSLPLVVEKLGDDRVRVTLGTGTQEIDDRTWSDYFHLDFELNPLIKVHAVTRVRVLTMEPFRLFVNTLDIDPANPPFWQPISQPMGYSADLVHRSGSPFETFGWACATMPFKSKDIEAEVLLEDIEFTMGWRERLALAELERDDWRLFMAVFSTPDRLQHMMYQYYDEEHPLHDPETAARRTTFFGQEIALKDAIPVMYEQVDRVVGRVLEKLRPDDTLIICADHGFQSFRHQFHVNNWLAKEGFLVLRPDVTTRHRSQLQYVDWSKTRAYSLGLGVIYLNLQGREREGIVKPEDADALLREIAARLLLATDDRPGMGNARSVDTATLFKDVHSGPYLDLEGDLMPGFAPYYRVSWATTFGDIKLETDESGKVVAAGVYEPNENPWSGDHVSVAPENVPGIFFCSRPVEVPDGGVHLLDIAPTALSLLGVAAPGDVDRPALKLR